MTTPSKDALWLTQAARDRLEAELDQLTRLTGSDRQQADGRIHELRQALRTAEVSEKPDDGLVEPGMTIVVQFEGEPSPTTFLLAHRQLASVDLGADLDVYSPTSPLGAAIIGKYPGDTFRYAVPSGADISGTIITAEPFRN